MCKPKEGKSIIILIILSVLLAAGLMVYWWSQSGKAPLSEVPGEELFFTNHERLSEIIENRDLSACDKIVAKEDSAICRSTIASLLAKEKLDVSFCEKLDGKKEQLGCRKVVLYEKAEREGVGVCRQVGTEEKRDCEKEYYLTMAIKKNDADQCLLLENERDINECREDFFQWQK